MEQESNIENQPIKPKWYTMVMVLALVWNILGLLAFYGQVSMTPEMIASLPANEQALVNAMPLWVTIAFAFAVIGGTVGCALMLAGRKLAVPVLLLSLVGVAVQMSHAFFISDAIEVYGPEGFVMPIMVLVIAIALWMFAKSAGEKGWLE